MKDFVITILLLLIAFAVPVNAHERSESYSHWYVSDSTISGVITIPLREVMLLYQSGDDSIPPKQLFRAQLENHTTVQSGGADCARTGSEILQAAAGFVRIEIRFACQSKPPTMLMYRALFDVAPGHVHYATLHQGTAQIAEVLITDTSDSWNIAAPASAKHTFGSFLRIGVEHIGTGLDHIAFLLGLLLVAQTAGRSIVAITGFTLGHSISLAAAVLGYVQADSQLVEAFIGFTIALVAVEYFVLTKTSAHVAALASVVLATILGLLAVWFAFLPLRALFAYVGIGAFAACYLLASRIVAQQTGARAIQLLFAATTCFGLVHGFGFAGFLMETGILGGALFVPLLGFNLGVEVGQLLIVTAVLSLAKLLAGRVPHAAPQIVAASLCGIGLYWFVGRTLS